MPSYICNNITELTASLEEDVRALLRGKMADALGEVLIEHIQQDVYDAYTPKQYKRRGVLANEAYLRTDVDGLSVSVTSVAPGNDPVSNGYRPTGDQLIGIIEEGAQGNGRGVWKDAFARPVVSNAQEEINQGTVVLRVLKDHYG